MAQKRAGSFDIYMHSSNDYAMFDKSRRQARIQDALRRARVPNQEALRAMLERDGCQVTQGTLSRDLRELGVVKTPEGYALPGEVSFDSGEAAHRALERALQEFLVSAEAAGQLVVVRTGVGHAQSLAVAMDGAGLEEALGTIAGDDTIFIATRSERDARRVASALLKGAGLA